MSDLMHDLRYGARLLRRAPGFTLLAISVLSLGIGATTGVFSVVDALLLRQLPYPEPDRIALLFEAPAARPAALEPVAPANVIDWKDSARSVETLAAAEPFGFTWSDGPEPQSLPGMRVSAGFFEAFGIRALYGRTFTADEYTAGRDRVVVLSHGTWTRHFGADRTIVGRTIRLNGQPHSVIGVMPASFAPRLLVTFSERGVFVPKIWTEVDRRIRGARFYGAVARLAPGVTIEQSQSEFDGIAARLAESYPRTNGGQTVQVIPLRDHLAGDLRPSIVVLVASVLLVLVIAMANTASLLMARSAARTREIAVRSAIGASRVRLVRQLLTEALLLAALGCGLGLLVADATIRLIVLLAPADIPALAEVGIDGRVLGFASVLTFLVAIVVGLVPARKGTTVGLADALAATTTRQLSARGKYGSARFVVAELAIALTLLMGGGLLLRSFSGLVDTSPGFRAEGVAALQIFAFVPNSTAPQRAAYIERIAESMRASPGVQEVGAASVIPFLDTTGGTSLPILIEGRPAPAAGEEPSAFVNVATPGYFPAMRIPRLDGRIFDEHDNASRTPVAVVTDTFARRHWQGRSPLGQFIQLALRGTKVRAEVVGVVADVRYDALDRPANQEVFLSHAQTPINEMTFVVRTAGDPDVLLGDLRRRLHAVAPNQAIYRTATMSGLIGESLRNRRFILALVLVFALFAIVLAATGVYGVMTVVSTQRTREYGLRLALGAARGEILRMVLGEGARITAAGIAAGLAGALLIGQLLRGLLFGIGPMDAWTLAAVCVTLAAVSSIACLLPALRATRVSPMTAMRTE